MALAQLICVALAIPVLLGLSFFFGWHQLGALRRLRDGPELPATLARGLRRQLYRRLVTCGLLALLALLLAGAQLFLEERADDLIKENSVQAKHGNSPELTPEQRDFARFYGAYWLFCLLILLTIVGLAGFDLWETRRNGLRERRRLLHDQRLMLQRQMTQFRERDERG